MWTVGMVLVLSSNAASVLTMGITALLGSLLLLAELVAGRPTCFVSLLWFSTGGVLMWLREDVGKWLANPNVKVGVLGVVAVLSLSMALQLRDERRKDKDPYGGLPGV